MSRGSRARDSEYSRDERRPRPAESSLESRIYIGNISVKNFSYRDVSDWMSKYGKVLDVTFFDRHMLIQFDRESDCRRAIDREKGQSFRGSRFDIRYAHNSDGSMGGVRSDVPRSRSPRALPYERDSRDISPGYREVVRERSPVERDRYYKEKRANSPDFRNYDRSRSNDERPRSDTRSEYPNNEYQEPNWNAPPLTNKVTSERPGFDAAIIVMSSDLLNYAETIESKLQRQIALTTHIIVLKEESHANACIDDLNNKAVLYAFLVNHMNEKHLSCTLRILYGSGQEHRNMLLTNALSFVARNFEDYQKRVRELKSIAPKPNYDPSRMPPGFVAPDDKTIYQLHLLADSRMLTIDELNEVDEFIQKRIQVLAQAEGIIEKPNLLSIDSSASSGAPKGMSLPTNLMVRDEKALIAQQNQLHSKILNILKPGSQLINAAVDKEPTVATSMVNNMSMDQQFSSYGAGVSGLGSNNDMETSTIQMTNNPLTNPKVQQALDSLMQSKFRPNLQDQNLLTDDNSSRNFKPQISSSINTNNSSIGQSMNNQYSNVNMNSSMNPSMNASMNQMMNSNNVAMNQGMNPGMMQGMNQNMNVTRNPNTAVPTMNQPPPIRGMQQAHSYTGYYQQQPLPQIGQPVYRPRQPFQPRPQYPGY